MTFVKICKTAELPPAGEMREIPVGGKVLCLTNEAGVYAAVDNVCPHQGGPLAEGLLEEGKVLCPWHAWGFDLKSGQADHDSSLRIGVYAIRVEGDEVLADL